MKFYMPTKVYDESNTVAAHAAELAALGSKALIVTGRHSAEKCGALQDVKDALESCGRACRQERPRPVSVDLPVCVKQLCLRCGPLAEQNGVRLRWHGNVAALRTAMDEDMLCRILLNLISNALRFTPRGGTVDVSWRAMGDYVEICVADDGAGIAPERLPYVFLRGESDGGHGHGLPIAQRLARTMGGGLTVSSQRGKGSASTLRLPVGAACAV